jgi:uncharacterized repeat protein (TIGR02543 family)
MSNMKKFSGVVASVLSLSMALSPLGTVSAQSVNDVQGHWAEQEISKFINSGSLKGYDDGSIKPNNTITRAEFVSLINRLFELSDTTTTSFTDLSPSNWAHDDIARAIRAGYVKGYSDNTFKPSSNVSRQEAAMMISSILGLDTSNTELINQFKDADKIPSWSQGSIAAVIDKKIMKGYPDGTFQAQKQLTRAEAIVLIDSALNNRMVTKETITIDTAGSYGSPQETKVINGNLIINVPGVILDNYEIKGDLLLASGIGSGDVTIKNVKVHGTTNVEGGGENSIHFVDSVFVKILVNKKDGSVRLVAEGTTTAQKVVLQSSAKLEEDNLKAEGFTDVELAKELPANAKVQLNGKFDGVDVFSASVTVQLQRGSIQEMNVNAGATNNTIQVSSGAQVANVVINAISKLLGASNIKTVTLNSGSQSSSFDARPQNVEGDHKGSIIVNTPSVISSSESSSSSSSSSGSSSSSSGGSSSNGGSNSGETKVKYTVSFELNGVEGQAPAPIQVESGKSVTLPTTPTRAGFSFEGWNTKSDGTGTVVTATTAITANTTLYAQWTLVAPKDGLKELGVDVTADTAKFLAYGLKNDENGKEIPSTLDEVKKYIDGKYDVKFNEDAIKFEEGKILITESILSKEDWNKVKTNGDKAIPYRITLLDSNNKKIAKIAMYQDGQAVIESLQKVKEYEVSFNRNFEGSEETTVVEVKAGESLELPVAPTREGYIFKGWNTQADGTGTEVTAATEIKANETFYAQWEEKVVVKEYKVSFNLNGVEGQAPASVQVEAGKSVTLPTAPTRAGYDFEGWAIVDEETVTLVNDETTITGDTTLYAQWILVAPADGLKELEVEVTADTAKFQAYGLKNDENGKEIPSTLTDVQTYIQDKYKVTFNIGAITFGEGKISVSGSPLSKEDWNKVKTNGDKAIPYRITLVEMNGEDVVKIAKIAMYQDGQAVIEKL